MHSIGRHSGVTLIELLVVIAIIGILVALVMPGYQSQVRSTHRADATAVLTRCAILMGRYYSANNYSYNGATTGETCPAKSPVDGTDEYYKINIQSVTATTYILAAVPQGGQSNDGCGILTLDQVGEQTAKKGTVDDCWR